VARGAIFSGGSRASDKRGPGHPDPEIRREGGGGRSTKKFSSALRASVWSKNRAQPASQT